jgi:hypothetical protein
MVNGLNHTVYLEKSNISVATAAILGKKKPELNSGGIYD